MNEDIAINLHEKLVRLETSLSVTRLAVSPKLLRKHQEALRLIEDNLKEIRQDIASEYFL